MNPARILLVDDEPDMLENCSRILSLQGHTSVTAANGRAALVVLEQEHPDLLVTDLKMPEMDGLTWADRVALDREAGRVVDACVPSCRLPISSCASSPK